MIKFKKFINSFSFKKLLYNKKFTVPLSVILAFVMWLLIVTKENPIIERSFADMTVNVNLENTMASDNGMSMIGDISEQKFTVIARGPTYLVSSLKAEDFNVYASAASVDAPGEYNLEVVAIANSANKGYEVLSVTPSTVKVSFDYIDTKEFTVKGLANGVTAKEGLIAENAVVSGAESDTITIIGPRTVMNKIDSVVAYADVNKMLDESTTFDAEIKLYNSRGKEIKLDNLTLSENKVKVTVPISKKKKVPVEVAFSNLPEGFDKDSVSYSLDHKTVDIIGKPDAVDNIKKITLSPIDISNISNVSNSFDVSAVLPDGIRLFDNIEHFTVKFSTSNYSQKIVTVDDFKLKNLDKNFSAKCSKIINVKICGPRSQVYNLRNSKVYAVVDLANKKEGEHSVEVLVCFKDNEKIWAVGLYNTTVTIKKK